MHEINSMGLDFKFIAIQLLLSLLLGLPIDQHSELNQLNLAVVVIWLLILQNYSIWLGMGPGKWARRLCLCLTSFALSTVVIWFTHTAQDEINTLLVRVTQSIIAIAAGAIFYQITRRLFGWRLVSVEDRPIQHLSIMDVLISTASVGLLLGILRPALMQMVGTHRLSSVVWAQFSNGMFQSLTSCAAQFFLAVFLVLPMFLILFGKRPPWNLANWGIYSFVVLLLNVFLENSNNLSVHSSQIWNFSRLSFFILFGAYPTVAYFFGKRQLRFQTRPWANKIISESTTSS